MIFIKISVTNLQTIFFLTDMISLPHHLLVSLFILSNAATNLLGSTYAFCSVQLRLYV